MLTERISEALALGVQAHDKQVRKGTLWHYRSLAEIFEQRRAPMAALLVAEVRQMEQLACVNA